VDRDQKMLAVTRGGFIATRSARANTPDPSLKTPQEITIYLESLAGRVERGELSRSDANTLKAIAEASLRAHEQNIAARLAELENLAASRAKAVRGGASVIVQPALPEGGNR
jgi:hypothetical protein